MNKWEVTHLLAVYAILNVATDKMYIGGTKRLSTRWHWHLRKLRLGIHVNKPLQTDFNLFGEEEFCLVILEECTQATLRAREQFWLDEIGEKYNIVPNSSNGGTWTPEKARKSSLALQGHVLSEETKRKIGEAHKGKIISEEHKQRIREFSRGRVQSEETRRKISEANKRRWAKTRREQHANDIYE